MRNSTLVTASLGFFGLLTPCLIADEKPSPWKQHTIDDSSRGADGVRLQDVNGDGLLDVATGWEEGGIVRAYLQPDTSKVHQPWPATTVGKVKSAEDAVFFDVDNDGNFDVVSCCEGSTRSIFVHWSPKEAEDFLNPKAWKTEPLPPAEKLTSWMFAVPLDMNGDGRTDLVAASKSKGAQLCWFECPEEPRNLNSWKHHHLADASWIMSVQAVDLDQDGDTDLLVSNRKGDDGRVFWMEQTSKGEWREHVVGCQKEEVMFLDTADMNGDGRLDILAPVKNRTIAILHQPEDPHTAWDRSNIEYPEEGYGNIKAVRAGDLDGDGLKDIAITNEGANAPLCGAFYLKAPNWNPVAIASEEGIKFDRIELIDVDQDGDLDLMTCEERDQLGVIWYENPMK